jgi:hypothetical protein
MTDEVFYYWVIFMPVEKNRSSNKDSENKKPLSNQGFDSG